MDIYSAVRAAQDYVAAFPDLFGGTNARLEETEIDDNGNWVVTLSFFLPGEQSGPSYYPARRDYKTFTIDAKTGKVTSMRIRNAFAAA
jgi:hypothetical protein